MTAATQASPARIRRKRTAVATATFAYAIHTNLGPRTDLVAYGLAPATNARALACHLADQHHIERPMGDVVLTIRVWAWPNKTRPTSDMIRQLAEIIAPDACRETSSRPVEWAEHAHQQVDWTVPGPQRPDGSRVVFSVCRDCRTQMHAIVEHGTFQPRFWRPVHIDLPDPTLGVATVVAADLDLRHIGAYVRSSADRPWTRLIAIQHPTGETGPAVVLLDSAPGGQLHPDAVLQIRH